MAWNVVYSLHLLSTSAEFGPCKLTCFSDTERTYTLGLVKIKSEVSKKFPRLTLLCFIMHDFKATHERVVKCCRILVLKERKHLLLYKVFMPTVQVQFVQSKVLGEKKHYVLMIYFSFIYIKEHSSAVLLWILIGS